MQVDCPHTLGRLISKNGDAPEWVFVSAWRPHPDDANTRWCIVCGEWDKSRPVFVPTPGPTLGDD